MKGFIEVHRSKAPVLVNVYAIEHIFGRVIFLTTPVAHFEDEYYTISCDESYDEIKRLIQEATNG